MRIPILLLCFGVAGCNRNLTPSCDAVAEHVEGLFGGPTESYAVDARGVFATRCTQDKWSPAMRTCLVKTRSLAEPQGCKLKLTPEQAKSLDADLAAVDQHEAMKILPGVCLRYEKMLAKVLTCDVLPPEARAQLKTNFEAFKATWPSTADKRTLEPICSNAIITVKQAAGTCPGSATW